MLNYFGGWRRKAGIITLTLACLFMGAWIRSRWRYDRVSINGTPFQYGVFSLVEQIHLIRTSHIDGAPFLMGPVTDDAKNIPGVEVDANGFQKYFDPSARTEIEWRTDWAGFHLSSGVHRTGKIAVRLLSIPYWSVAIPLMALSAWFLLSKQRQAKRIKSHTEPAA